MKFNLKFLYVFLLGALMPLIAYAEPSQNDLEAIEKKAEEQSLKHKQLQAQAVQINMELNSISKNLVKSAKLIQNSEDKLSIMEKELDTLKEDLTKAEQDFSEEDDNLIKTLAALQNLALKPTEALFVQPLSPVDTIRSAMLLRETVPYLEENANRIRKEMEKINIKKELVEQQISRIAAQKIEMEQETEQMKSLIEKKSKIRSEVEQKSEKTKKQAVALVSQAQDLRDLLDKLKAEKKADDTKSSDLIKLNQGNINEIGEAFVKAKGNILMPVRGTINVSFGEETSKGVRSKGVMIKSRSRAQVIAPFDGLVIFAESFRGYGNLIIIEHGRGYVSLIAGMGSVDCENGQMLLAGEPIGQMPNSDDAKLYMEIRKENQAVNPLDWIVK